MGNALGCWSNVYRDGIKLRLQFGSCETAGRHSTVVTVCGAVVLEQPACAACSCYAVDEPVTQ
jgi:hypothetical protein